MKRTDEHSTEKHNATVPPVCFSQLLAKKETILRAKQHQRTSAGPRREGKRAKLKENERGMKRGCGRKRAEEEKTELIGCSDHYTVNNYSACGENGKSKIYIVIHSVTYGAKTELFIVSISHHFSAKKEKRTNSLEKQHCLRYQDLFLSWEFICYPFGTIFIIFFFVKHSKIYA